MLRNAAGDYAQIPWNMDGQYVVHVVPGTYDLFYAKDNTVQSSTPANQLAKLRAGVVVAPTGTTALDIDITSTLVMGALTINGVPAAAGIEEGMGFASIGDNVEFCVSGFDRWMVYNGRCRVLR